MNWQKLNPKRPFWHASHKLSNKPVELSLEVCFHYPYGWWYCIDAFELTDGQSVHIRKDADIQCNPDVEAVKKACEHHALSFEGRDASDW